MKQLFFSFLLTGCLAGTGLAQNDSKNLNPGQLLFKVYNNPEKDQTDQFEIQALGTTTFTASNTADGSANSYRHSLQIVVGLIPVNRNASTSFQLHFYSPNDNIQQAAMYKDGTLSIYYPVEVYDDIRAKLEQALAAKKKVSVKVVQKTNGYREGTLLF